ncbi:hypothetical protein SELMODRAFT_412358 [Selaginella moellendorffii]|uniref:F-box domain-containing protein n=1 Tax=Selaginella moellendorffii TaxID=88036 RepID=D8RKW6_SELML|nr:hypothetical protein SELMODRAFT_412358 [Selaginella moellendorffii]
MDQSCCCGAFERLQEEDLVLYILSFLHNLRDLFRLRAVCKSWYRAVLSRRFITVYASSPSLRQLWCALRVRTEVPDDIGDFDNYYDYRMTLQNHVELWRPKDGGPESCCLTLGPQGSHFVGLCSSNGLVCGRLMEHESSLALAVGNPITNSWRTLPPPPIEECDVLPPPSLTISMLHDQDQGSYQIVVLYTKDSDAGPADEIGMKFFSDEKMYLVYPVQYDSKAGIWESGLPFSFDTSQGSPLRGNAIYTYHVAHLILAYDPSSRLWSHYDRAAIANVNPEIDRGGDWEGWTPLSRLVFTYKGKYYLASQLVFWQDVTTYRSLGFSIWELNYELAGWVLVSRVLWRDLACSPMHEEEDHDWKLEVVGDMVVFSCFYKKATFGTLYPFAYDMIDSSWIAPCHEQNQGSFDDLECSYSFFPSLSARP